MSQVYPRYHNNTSCVIIHKWCPVRWRGDGPSFRCKVAAAWAGYFHLWGNKLRPEDLHNSNQDRKLPELDKGKYEVDVVKMSCTCCQVLHVHLESRDCGQWQLDIQCDTCYRCKHQKNCCTTLILCLYLRRQNQLQTTHHELVKMKILVISECYLLFVWCIFHKKRLRFETSLVSISAFICSV